MFRNDANLPGKYGFSIHCRLIALVAVLFLINACEEGSEQESLPGLDWMVGEWIADSNDGQLVETWHARVGKQMHGTGKFVQQGTIVSSEIMTIEFADEPVLIAQPEGQAPVRFRRVLVDTDQVVFENANHDFPQRIAYRRVGDVLQVEISTVDGLRRTAWDYQMAD